MLNNKYILNNFTPLDGDYLARTLEKQARKGWILSEYGTMLLHFRKTEPQELHYAVTFFPEATEYDPHMSEGQEAYIDMCAQQGWTLIATKGPMQIFQSDRSNPIPIETDEAYKLQAIHGAIKKSYLLGRVLLLISMALQLMTQWQNFRFNAFSMVSSNTNLALITAILLLTGYLLFETGWYFIWYYGSKRAITEANPCLPTLSRLRNCLIAIPSGAALLLIAVLLLDASGPNARLYYISILAAVCGIFVILTFLLKWFKKLGWEGKKIRNATIAISVILSLALCGGMVWFITAFDVLPSFEEQIEATLHLPKPKLTLADLADAEDSSVNWAQHEIKESILATYTFYLENGSEGSLEYQLVEIRWDFLRELVFSTMADRYHFTDDDRSHFDDRWTAEMAYIRGEDRYIALYNGCILYVDSSPALTDDQVGRIVYHLVQ